MLDHGLQVHHLVPVLRSKKHHRHLLAQLLGLDQGHQFEKLIERPETAGKGDQRLRQIGEPELAGKEVVEDKSQLAGDVGIFVLLERQRDIQPDVHALGFRGAPVGGLHDARSAAGADDKAPGGVFQAFRPFGEAEGQLPGRFVIARHLQVQFRLFQVAAVGPGGLQCRLRLITRFAAGRPEKDDGVADIIFRKTGFRFQVFGQHAQGPGLPAFQEVDILVGLDRPGCVVVAHGYGP